MTWEGLDESPGRIRELLASRGLALKKRWGQNFMISGHARRRIVSELGVEEGELVWEIGPGLGSITAFLLDRGARVVVFEVDYGLIGVIRERFGDSVTVVEGDAVKTLPQAAGDPDRIAGNLPYRSAAAIVSTILECERFADVRRMVFTVQREMARRMVAEPGSSDYSPFSVLCSIASDARLAGELARGNFYPAPDVVSSVVVLEPRRSSRACGVSRPPPRARCSPSVARPSRTTPGTSPPRSAPSARRSSARSRRSASSCPGARRRCRPSAFSRSPASSPSAATPV